VRSAGEDLVWRRGAEGTSLVDRLHQLRARSRQEIEVHAGELGDTDTSRYFIGQAAEEQ
jgi:hypothetical protein